MTGRSGVVWSLSVLLFAAACAPSDDRPPLTDPDDSRWTEAAPAGYRAVFETSKGSFVIEVQREWAPVGADRFYHLIRAGFLDDSRLVHRVIPDGA